MTRLHPGSDHHYHFVTGRLAEAAVRDIVGKLSSQHSFAYSIGVMPITVAALMTPKWLLRHLDVPADATHLILPGYCERGVEDIAESSAIPVVLGPRDCRALPELFGQKSAVDEVGPYDIEIIAEINHVPRLSLDSVVVRAQQLVDAGADRIDIGADPAERCTRIGDYVAAICDMGIDVSIDTFDAWEVTRAVERGASLVLSVNSKNAAASPDWGCEVVVIPDSPEDKKSFEKTVDFLLERQVAIRLDPILEPIGTGLMKSLIRYSDVRKQFPHIPMMMGIGNLTELSDVDSAGINFLLLGICQELRIESVLTTQVINWARTSVRECDIARRLVHYSVNKGVPPKRLSSDLVMLRDAKLMTHSDETLEKLANTIRDNNYRLFAQDELIHLLSSKLHLSDADPFQLFQSLMDHEAAKNVDPGHAFYLGFEMAKASISLLLGKQYEQDEPLQWGFLEGEQEHHRLERPPISKRDRGT